MGMYNLRVQIETVKDLLAKGNGTFQFQDLVTAMGSKEKRARFAVCEARRAGTTLYAIREMDAGKRGAGRVVAYTTDAALATAKKAPAVKAPKAAKVAKIKKVAKAPKAPKAAKTATAPLETAEPMPTPVAAAESPAPKLRTMSLDEVRARLKRDRAAA